MNLNVYKGRKVLVTGHTGFKGAWLCEWLLSLGAEVYGFSIDVPTRPSLFCQLKLSKRLAADIRGDIRDFKSVLAAVRKIKPDFVFHLAAQPLVRYSYAHPIETFEANVMGTANLLESVRQVFHSPNHPLPQSTNQTISPSLNRPIEQSTNRPIDQSEQSNNPPIEQSTNRTIPQSNNQTMPRCSVICITTDKVYENNEKGRPFKETDAFGGYDPYSASKGACEIVISSYKRSYFNDPSGNVWVASARAGNVIGGGDWAKDRIIPDCFRAIQAGKPIPVRNKVSTRPWQHVLEPLSAYLALGAALDARKDFECVSSGFNFGPNPADNRTVKDVVEELLKHVKGTWEDRSDPHAVHEAGLLNLDIRKAAKVLKWKPTWDFATTIAQVAEWYQGVADGESPLALTQRQIKSFTSSTP